MSKVREHFDEEAARYDSLVVRLIPGYREQHEAPASSRMPGLVGRLGPP